MAMFDFGQGNGVVLNPNDAFFLDTNFLVAAVYEKDPYHEAAFFFAHYLEFMGVNLYINSTVVTESVNSLARVLFVDDIYQRTIYLDPTKAQLTGRSKRQLLLSIRKQWQEVLKNDLPLLSYYNEIASSYIEVFVQNCKILPTNRFNLLNALNLCSVIPMGSTDAIIIAETEALATSGKLTGIVSFDRDFPRASAHANIDLYSAPQNEIFLGRNAKNIAVNALRIIQSVPNYAGNHFETFMKYEMGQDATGRDLFDIRYA